MVRSQCSNSLLSDGKSFYSMKDLWKRRITRGVCVCDNAITRASENSMLKNSRSIQFAGKVKIKMRKRRTNEREKSTVKYACGLFFGKNTWEFVGWYHLSAYSLRKRDDEGHNGGDASFIIFICVRDAFLTCSRSLSFFLLNVTFFTSLSRFSPQM